MELNANVGLRRRALTSRRIIARPLLCPPLHSSLLPPRPKESRRRRGPRRNFSIGPTKIPFVREHVLSSKNISFVQHARLLYIYVYTHGPYERVHTTRYTILCRSRTPEFDEIFFPLDYWIGRLVLFSFRRSEQESIRPSSVHEWRFQWQVR